MLCLLVVSVNVSAAPNGVVSEASKGLTLRSIGPALMGGRIADIAIHPDHKNLWYVAVGSGGVWKTNNAGTSWTSIFDDQASYSIGDVAVDPNNPDVVWVGTGENVSGRHVGWGSGVYKSLDGGKTWANLGLTKSEHIAKILVDPRDSNIVYVAAEGPLWAEGGERGVYKTTDGGVTWQAILEIDENTGVTDLEFHPTNPDVLYAAAYERRRHVWGLMAGGPNGGIYKSSDAGASWSRKTEGLPSGDVGKIGLAVTQADPQRVYATIEADDDNKGFYRSMDQGESFSRTNNYISGGTGPHYYMELSASQQTADLVFQMDVFFRVTRDGGEQFSVLGTGREKHSDNHALWIDPENDQHLLAGTDAGLYETFDQGINWRHFPNLPISQFYKVAVDNTEPFYNILGGTQDLGTLFGPSRTMITEGVRNQDWYVPLGADGYGVAFDPSDNNVGYMEFQQGYMFRHHRDTNELVHIQPQPKPGDAPERWNWDTPIVVSAHDSSRLYVGSQRVWQSDDRGSSWRALSEDLTTNENRYEREYRGRVWSVDALHDNGAMSKYATISTISESPVKEGTLYSGSDDGLIHSTQDGGATWQRARQLPSDASPLFINDLEASQHNADTVFAVADGHKLGDFSPYVFVSNNHGQSWRSIAGDLPDGTIAWAIEQDHEDENLLFLGTEYALYFSVNGGTNWNKVAGSPTIAFRDLKLQRRDNDLVGATFGRGIYVLDDYSALRFLGQEDFGRQPVVFPVRDAWWYIPSVPTQAVGMPTMGSDSFRTANPEFGATFTYYLPEALETKKQVRREGEKALREDGRNVAFPGWDALGAEAIEAKPKVLLLVSDGDNKPVRWIEAVNKKGSHRATWDLRRPAPDAVDLSTPEFIPPWVSEPQGPLAAPGNYSVQLFTVSGGKAQPIGASQSFLVKPVRAASDGTDYAEVAAFQQKSAELMRQIVHAGEELKRTRDLLSHMQAAAIRAPAASPELMLSLDALGAELNQLQVQLSGDRVRQGLNESVTPSIGGRAYNATTSWNTTQLPTETQRSDYAIASREYTTFSENLEALLEGPLAELEVALAAAGAPSWR
ncbi:MAG: WD40/YVTN/BNR-like repeat-containing protein [Lysobacterales bacterium]